MQFVSAQDIIAAFEASGLFTREQVQVLARELNAFGDDTASGLKHLVKHRRITPYQLGKVRSGKAAELRVGPYLVLDKVGEGGMGKVFRARHTLTGRVVALKVIRPALVSNPTVRGRYAREVQVTGKLVHQNVVRIEDAGEANGKFYLAMEFVDGIDLTRLMKDYGSVAVTEACEYIRQAALGLHHAHEQGIVHRDIKPSNIVVAGERHVPQATEPALVKVLDLGLARAIDPDDMVAPNLTRDHTVVGTPDYMAPEQARSSKSVDGRADLYSLGCTFYFLLTGQAPFSGGNAIEKMMAHQTQPAPSVQALRPEVPSAVAAIVARLLAKKPDDRYASAAELAATLEPHAKFPAGAAPVPVERPPAHRHTAPAAEDTTGAQGHNSSAGSLPRLDFSSQASADPLPLAAAPPETTPRPPARRDAPPVVEPRRTPSGGSAMRHPAAKRAGTRRPAPAANPVPRVLKWVLVTFALLLLVGLAVWALTLGPIP
ncbi:MAG: protein kinase domain-containing protein [Gemmata sp.]